MVDGEPEDQDVLVLAGDLLVAGSLPGPGGVGRRLVVAAGGGVGFGGAGPGPTSAPPLTLAQLDAVLERFVVETYHAREHSETGQPPAVRWIGEGWIPRTPDRPDDLDLLLLTAATGRIVQRDGIRFAGTRYVSPVLAAYVGETVAVRYDPRDAAELRVYHHDQYLCRAIAPELAAGAVTLKQLQDARTARRKALKAQLRDRRSAADALPADHRYLPPVPATTAPTAPAAAGPVEPTPTHRLRTYATD